MPMKCEFCGMEYETPPGKFCDRCGRVLARFNVEPENEDVTDFKKCKKCGLRNPLEARVCSNCGELLHEQQIY